MDSSAPEPGEWVELGRVVGLFGLRGQLKVNSYTEPAEGLLRYPSWRLSLPGGRIETRRLIEGRRKGRQVVVSLEQVDSCEAARELIGATVEVARRDLPGLGRNEYYEVDLIGLRVLNQQGVELGRVTHFLQMPAHPVMVVRGDAEHWVPVTPQHLKRVDLSAGALWVDWDTTFHAED